MDSNSGLVSIAAGLGMALGLAPPADAAFTPKQIWLHAADTATQNNFDETLSMICPVSPGFCQTGSFSMANWATDPVLSAVNVFAVSDLFMQCQSGSLNSSSTCSATGFQNLANSGLATWLSEVDANGNPIHALEITVGAPVPASTGTCATTVNNTQSHDLFVQIPEIASVLHQVIPSIPGKSTTLYLELDEPLGHAYYGQQFYMNGTTDTQATCTLLGISQMAASILETYAQNLTSALSSSQSLTIIMGDSENSSNIVHHEVYLASPTAWITDLNTFFNTFAGEFTSSGSYGTSLNCGTSTGPVCIQPNFGFFNFDMAWDDSVWVSDAVRLTKFLQTISPAPKVGVFFNAGSMNPPPTGQYGSGSGTLPVSDQAQIANADSFFVTSTQAQMQEYLESGDVASTYLPDNFILYGWGTFKTTDQTQVAQPSYALPQPPLTLGLPTPPTTLYSLLNYFNTYISQVASPPVTGSLAPTTFYRIYNPSTGFTSYGPGLPVAGSTWGGISAVVNLQENGNALQYPLGDIYVTQSNAIGLVPLYEYPANPTSGLPNALTTATSTTGTYNVWTGTNLVSTTLSSGYSNHPVLVGYVLPAKGNPATTSCSVPINAISSTGSGMPSNPQNCTSLSNLPVFQFEKAASGGVNYVYTTDYCIPTSGVICPTNSQGKTYMSSAGGGYTFDGIVFYVSADVPVMAPSSSIVPATPETVPPIIYTATKLESSGRPLDFANGAIAVVPAASGPNGVSPLNFYNPSYTTTLTMLPVGLTGTYTPPLPLMPSPYVPNCAVEAAPASQALQCKVEINAAGIDEKQENLFDNNAPGAPIIFDMYSQSNTLTSAGAANSATTISPGYTYTAGTQTGYPYICVYNYHNKVVWSSGPGTLSSCY